MVPRLPPGPMGHHARRLGGPGPDHLQQAPGLAPPGVVGAGVVGHRRQLRRQSLQVRQQCRNPLKVPTDEGLVDLPFHLRHAGEGVLLVPLPGTRPGRDNQGPGQRKDHEVMARFHTTPSPSPSILQNERGLPRLHFPARSRPRGHPSETSPRHRRGMASPRPSYTLSKRPSAAGPKMGLWDGPNPFFGAPRPICPHSGKMGKAKRAVFDRFFRFLIAARRNRAFSTPF